MSPAGEPAPPARAANRLELCSISDARYLPRLLVLAGSLARAGLPQRLNVICLDELTQAQLEGRAGITAIPSEAVVADDLEARAVRGERGAREWAWTLKPLACRYVLRHRPDADAVLFLDADLMFFSDAAPILDELARASILLTYDRPVPPPAWSAAGVRLDFGTAQGATMGHYNSGLVAFRRDADGEAALDWWRARCLEACEDASVAGRHGDQWYLNFVPERFAGVRTIEDPGVGLAPWSSRRARFERRGDGLYADGHPLVFYHFHSMALRRATLAARLAAGCNNDVGALDAVRPPMRMVYARHLRLPERERELLWQPYRQRVAEAVSELLAADPGWARLASPLEPRELVADLASELRWRGYLVAGRALPSPLRATASRLRARLRPADR